MAAFRVVNLRQVRKKQHLLYKKTGACVMHAPFYNTSYLDCTSDFGVDGEK